jgi:hypothetical protein
MYGSSSGGELWLTTLLSCSQGLKARMEGGPKCFQDVLTVTENSRCALKELDKLTSRPETQVNL